MRLMEVVPDEPELRTFLHRMLVEARRTGDQERVDALLDKLSNVEELRTFLACVLND